ncbi:MAG TPA: MoxR family ATPase [Anaerolineae bacterium]|nr:MoxR family ATPase [Anaerolineae bacterium]
MIIAETAARIRANVQKVIVGKGDVIDLALVAVLCEGHILIEDVPGIGKTTLAKALAASLGLNFRRIQFTPDLLPSDVTGINVFNQKTQDFEFRPGPVFANVVLADEINRATPRTQSAMLEAMQERQVTADGETRLLPRPFLVVATQNPIELEGTFPLPEAQIDRFLVRLPLGYPSVEEEESILLRFQDGNPLDTLRAVASIDELATLSHEARKVRVEASVRRYIVELVRATRDREEVELGASPRGTLALYNAAQAYAAIQDRSFVLPDDVKRLVPYVLTHRIILSPQMRLRGRRPEDVVAGVVENVPVPVEEVKW